MERFEHFLRTFSKGSTSFLGLSETLSECEALFSTCEGWRVDRNEPAIKASEILASPFLIPQTFFGKLERNHFLFFFLALPCIGFS